MGTAIMTDAKGRGVHFGQLVRSARRVLRINADAEDAAQETLMEAVAKGLRDRPLIFFVLHRRSLDLRARIATRREFPERDHEIVAWDRCRVAHPRSEDLHAAVALLPPRQCQAIRLRFLEGLTEAEAAREMRCTRQAVFSNVQKALVSLRKRLNVQPQENGR